MDVEYNFQEGKLVCNDVSISRLNKLKNVLNLYLPGTEEWSKKILISNLDVADWCYFDSFDKVFLFIYLFLCSNEIFKIFLIFYKHMYVIFSFLLF